MCGWYLEHRSETVLMERTTEEPGGIAFQQIRLYLVMATHGLHLETMNRCLKTWRSGYRIDRHVCPFLLPYRNVTLIP